VTTTGDRLRVDPIACDGRGLCAEVLPELITLDDWGFPIIRDGEVPPRLMAGAEEAIRLCPLLVLRLDRSGAKAAARRRPSAAVRRPGRQVRTAASDDHRGDSGTPG
jgi:ferredoxin